MKSSPAPSTSPSNPTTLVILAAGIGRRYGGLKQLVPVGPADQAILDYTVFDARRAGFGKLVLVIREETAEEFRSTLGRRLEGHVPVAYAFQRPDDLPPGCPPVPERTKPWGTGHAVLAAAPGVEGPFAVVNADDFYGAEAFRVLGRFLRSAAGGEPPALAMVGFTVRQTVPATGTVARALCHATADGWLREIVEILNLERQGDGASYTEADGTVRTVGGDELVSMNMWGFVPAVFAHLRRSFRDFLRAPGRSEEAEFLLPAVVGELIREGKARVKVLASRGQWCGMTYQQDQGRVAAMIEDLVARGDYPSQLWA